MCHISARASKACVHSGLDSLHYPVPNPIRAHITAVEKRDTLRQEAVTVHAETGWPCEACADRPIKLMRCVVCWASLACSTEDKPRWDMVDVQYVSHLPRFVTLTELRQHSKPGGSLEGMPLFTRFRLSVMPLEQRYWDAIVNMANEPGPESEDKK